MSFADDLHKTAEQNKQTQLSVIECFKKEVIEKYPSQVEAIKKDCFKQAKFGRNVLVIDYDNNWGAKFYPAHLSNVSSEDAYTAKAYSEYYIKKLLEKEGFTNVEVNTRVQYCGLSFFDDRNYFNILQIVIRW